MKLFNTLVFDDTISGSTTTWYTPAEFHERLGAADQLTFLASAANVTGTTPVLTVQAEHSADGQNWVNVAGTPEISVDISGTPVNMGYVSGIANVTLAFLRLRMSFTGTNPQCRLKITVTGRTY